MKNGNLGFDLFILQPECDALLKKVKQHAADCNLKDPVIVSSDDFKKDEAEDGSCFIVLHPNPSALAGEFGFRNLSGRSTWALFLGAESKTAQYVSENANVL